MNHERGAYDVGAFWAVLECLNQKKMPKNNVHSWGWWHSSPCHKTHAEETETCTHLPRHSHDTTPHRSLATSPSRLAPRAACVLTYTAETRLLFLVPSSSPFPTRRSTMGEPLFLPRSPSTSPEPLRPVGAIPGPQHVRFCPRPPSPSDTAGVESLCEPSPSPFATSTFVPLPNLFNTPTATTRTDSARDTESLSDTVGYSTSGTETAVKREVHIDIGTGADETPTCASNVPRPLDPPKPSLAHMYPALGQALRAALTAHTRGYPQLAGTLAMAAVARASAVTSASVPSTTPNTGAPAAAVINGPVCPTPEKKPENKDGATMVTAPTAPATATVSTSARPRTLPRPTLDSVPGVGLRERQRTAYALPGTQIRREVLPTVQPAPALPRSSRPRSPSPSPSPIPDPPTPPLTLTSRKHKRQRTRNRDDGDESDSDIEFLGCTTPFKRVWSERNESSARNGDANASTSTNPNITARRSSSTGAAVSRQNIKTKDKRAPSPTPALRELTPDPGSHSDEHEGGKRGAGVCSACGCDCRSPRSKGSSRRLLGRPILNRLHRESNRGRTGILVCVRLESR
jgi:hypothetical protein